MYYLRKSILNKGSLANKIWQKKQIKVNLRQSVNPYISYVELESFNNFCILILSQRNIFYNLTISSNLKFCAVQNGKNSIFSSPTTQRRKIKFFFLEESQSTQTYFVQFITLAFFLLSLRRLIQTMGLQMHISMSSIILDKLISMQNPLQWFFVKKTQSLPQELGAASQAATIPNPIRKSPPRDRQSSPSPSRKKLKRFATSIRPPIF